MFFVYFAIFLSIVSAKPKIEVSGSAQISVSPTDLHISFTFTSLESKATDSLTATNKKLGAVVNALLALNLTKDDFSTSSFSLNSESENILINDHYENKFKGYRSTQSLIVNTNRLGEAGKFIDAAVKSVEDIKVDYVNFEAKKSLLQDARDKLIENAVLDAKNKANLALKPLGYEVKNVKKLIVNEAYKSLIKK